MRKVVKLLERVINQKIEIEVFGDVDIGPNAKYTPKSIRADMLTHIREAVMDSHEIVFEGSVEVRLHKDRPRIEWKKVLQSKADREEFNAR